MDWLLEIDEDALLAVNGLSRPWLDEVMWALSSKVAWIPVYALLLFGLVRLLGWKRALLSALLVIVLIAIADQVTASFLKPYIARPRPCHTPGLLAQLHLVNNKCGGPFGFASSHSANFFALATYMAYFFRWGWRGWPYFFFLMAGLVAFSRVYLGVHYPGDVIVGAAIGVLDGLLVIFLYQRINAWLTRKQIVS